MTASQPRLIVFSGAGLSAESGLRTFRGADGLWEGVPIRQVCHIETWEENFEAVHDFYDARRDSCAQAEPNAAHRQIAAWQQAWPERTVLLTQNVDCLLERAGCRDVIRLHGDVRTLWCVECGHEWQIEKGRYDRKNCPVCHGAQTIKPGVVFFGESAPRYRDLHEVCASLKETDTVIVIGTSGTVLPADQLFAYTRAFSILVNLEPAGQMNEAAFTERRYGPATREIPPLDALVRARMK